MDYSEEAVIKLKAPSPELGQYAGCLNGHDHHKTMIVEVSLSGQPKIQDMPPVPQYLKTNLLMEVYDWRKYFTVGTDNVPHQKYEKYCPGQDIISYCIDMQGVWEGYETLLIMDILNKGKAPYMFDFGSHIGWYTMLAAKQGYDIECFDANAENLEIVRNNAARNGVSDNVSTNLCWLDKDVPHLNPAEGEPIELLKCDVEGAEKFVYHMMIGYFTERKINHAIFEISPVFNDSYPMLVEQICACGYDAYLIPGKGWEHTEEFSKAPLQTIKKYCGIPAEGRMELVASWRQENLLFVRQT